MNPNKDTQSSNRFWAKAVSNALILVIVTTSLLLCSLQVFGTFMRYDDEGYMMELVGRMLSGKALYRDIPIFYGPFYFLFKYVLHGALNVPLTNNATRIISLITSLSVSGMLGWVTYRLTRNVVLVCWAWAATIVHLRIFGLEPGHPQELITFLLTCSALIAMSLGSRTPSYLVSGFFGAVGAALLLTKVNVGVLFMGSIVLSGLVGLSGGRWTKLCKRPVNRIYRTRRSWRRMRR
jgi:hypothetical protein